METRINKTIHNGWISPTQGQILTYQSTYRQVQRLADHTEQVRISINLTELDSSFGKKQKGDLAAILV